MGIEFFTMEGRGFEPKVSIRKQGQIGLNHGAAMRYEIKTGQFVLLGYDRDKNMVALEITSEKKTGAKEVNIREKNITIPAKSFLDYFDIKYKDKTRQFNLEIDDESGCLIFYLDNETEVT